MGRVCEGLKWWDVLARAQGEHHPAHHLKRRRLGEALASKKWFTVVLCRQEE
jgi:hypothetical protein